MPVIRRSPWVPLSIVLACSLASAGAAWRAAADDAPDLAALETAALAEGADAEAWWAYAAALSAGDRLDHALQAVDQVLAQAPYHEGARRERALVLARSDDLDGLHAWMEDLVFTHPAMADGLFQHPDLAACLAEERFRELAAEARIQAVD